MSDAVISYIIRNPNQVAAEIDGDLVMMNIGQGEYYGITGVGSRIWELLATPATVADIVRVICTEYDVEEAQCQADTQAFVEELIKLGLASVV